MPISKTDYIIYRDCAKNAWVKIHRPEVYYAQELSEFDKHIIETGNEVESVARKLHPTGVMVEGRGEEGQAKTAELIAAARSGKQALTLFQPVFVADGFLAALDILKYDPALDSFSVHEVKATNEVDEKVHLHDLSFQVNLLRRAGFAVHKAYLVHLNPEYIRAGELDIIKLFVEDDLTERAEEMQVTIAAEMDAAKAYLSSDTEPGPVGCTCLYKGRSGHCTSFQHLNPQVPAYGVHDITRIGASKRKLAELIDSGIFHIHEVPEGMELSVNQRNQVDAHIMDRSVISKPEISEELSKLAYPLYFLDYETFPAAVPRFDGFSPYQQVPFQYSLHILDAPLAAGEDAAAATAAGTLRHADFIFTEAGANPTQAFADALMRDIGPVGSVIVWNKKFEMMINRQLAMRLGGPGGAMPEITGFIESVNGRVFDLMEIFSKQLYVHKGFKGSSSIKKVLPVLVPDLSYKELEVNNGGIASDTWNKIVTGVFAPDEAARMTAALREYCKLDTYAMYAIWAEVVRQL